MEPGPTSLRDQHTTTHRLTMDDNDGDYLDSLRRGRLVPLRGNPPGDSSQESFERQVDGGMALGTTFAATPPDSNHHRVRNTNDSRGSRFQNRDNCDLRDKYWKNKHAVNDQEYWGTVIGKYAILPPVTEIVEHSAT